MTKKHHESGPYTCALYLKYSEVIQYFCMRNRYKWSRYALQNVDVCLTFAGLSYGWIMKNQSVESDPFHDKLIHITKPVWMIHSWIRLEFSSWVQLTESMIRSQSLLAQWQLQVTFRSIRHTILHMNLLLWFIRKLQFPLIVNTRKSQIILLFKCTTFVLHKKRPVFKCYKVSE